MKKSTQRIITILSVMAVILLIFYPLSRKKTEELQLAKELKLKEAYENQEIDI